MLQNKAGLYLLVFPQKAFQVTEFEFNPPLAMGCRAVNIQWLFLPYGVILPQIVKSKVFNVTTGQGYIGLYKAEVEYKVKIEV